MINAEVAGLSNNYIYELLQRFWAAARKKPVLPSFSLSLHLLRPLTGSKATAHPCSCVFAGVMWVRTGRNMIDPNHPRMVQLSLGKAQSRRKHADIPETAYSSHWVFLQSSNLSLFVNIHWRGREEQMRNPGRAGFAAIAISYHQFSAFMRACIAFSLATCSDVVLGT